MLKTREDYSEERHRKRGFPAPTPSFPSIEKHPHGNLSRGIRCQPQTPNKNSRERLIHLHPMKITCPGAIQRHNNNSVLRVQMQIYSCS